MTIILSASLSSAETAPVARNRPMTWTGFDGSVWQLTRPGRPNPRMAPGVKGLHMPRMDVHVSASPLVPGDDVDGYELPARSVYWPLIFRSRSIEQWEEDHADFFDSFHPERPGIWTVGEGEAARTLPLNGSFDGSYSFARDPFVSGHALIGVELTAHRPLWRGERITRRFKPPAGVSFFPGPPLHISPGATFENASIDNPGNEPSYLEWTVDGPQPSGTRLGVGAALIVIPFPIAEGRRLVINTDPAAQYALIGDLVEMEVDGETQTVMINATDCARDLGFQIFAPIPAKGTAKLEILADDAGGVVASHVPLYWRAF